MTERTYDRLDWLRSQRLTADRRHDDRLYDTADRGSLAVAGAARDGRRERTARIV